MLQKALPVGVAFKTADYFFPLITGKDIGCGVMYLRISQEDWLRPFNKQEHYKAFTVAHTQMTDDGLGGGNHFLSIEEDDDHVYIICHTGTRDRGIALYQHCIELTRNYSKACGEEVEYVHRDFIDAGFEQYYHDTLHFGYERRKNFCIKTLIFLQHANYIRCNKTSIDRIYLRSNYSNLPQQGILHGTTYTLEDSVHNHLRFNGREIIHRKGSTELGKDRTVVIPLSMSRGSLLVKAANIQDAEEALFSCAHGAGRKLSRFTAPFSKFSLLKSSPMEPPTFHWAFI